MTSKVTNDGTNDIEIVDYTYNLQNRLETVTTAGALADLDSDSYDDDRIVEISVYTYNPSGIRVTADYWRLEYYDYGTGSQTSAQLSRSETDYLVDPYNHTGYAQVLEEITIDYNASDDETGRSRIQYTIGDDVISQTESTWSVSAWMLGDTQYLLYDGHGSTRQLLDHAYTVDGGGKAIIDDCYSYDGYGVMLGGNPTPSDSAATNLLYAGEQFDANLGQYYIRARYYDQNNGRFNRTDPFPGNTHDPQSLHKYLYAHANPINGIDPSGMYLGGMSGIAIAIAIGAMIVVTGLTIYSGIRHKLKASAIAIQVVLNLAAFTAIAGALLLSGPIAIAAGVTVGVTAVVGFIQLARSWPGMDTTDKVIAGATVLAFLAFAGAVRTGAAPKAPPPGSIKGNSVLPESYYSRVVIDMRNAPPGSSTNAAGFPRNGPWFWRQVRSVKPEFFSPKNMQRINNGRSPKIDSQWIKFHPKHASNMGGKLVSHHPGQGAYAVGLPETVHQTWNTVLHSGSGD